MKHIKRIIGVISAAILLTVIAGVVYTQTRTAKNFRTVSYIVGSNLAENQSFDESHLSQQTDIIFIGEADFDTKGEIIFSKDFEYKLQRLRSAMKSTGSAARLHLNLIGPGSKTSSEVWEEQMDSLASEHEKAFSSGVLEENILKVLEKYGFDGIFFDYEYPLSKEHWRKFEAFLTALDDTLGEKYIIGAAISAWNVNMTRKGAGHIDMVELMCYDIWDKQGNHSPLSLSVSALFTMVTKGFKLSQIDMGIPFYARPTTQEAYWYDYKSWYNKLDENGLCYDDETGLTFSFNDYNTVYKKTKLAIKLGVGGVMVWHYSCDTPKQTDCSLFGAVEKAVNETGGGST